MARSKQQKVSKSLSKKACGATTKKTRVPAKKTSGKPSVASKATGAKSIQKSTVSKKAVVKKASASKPVQKTSASNKTASKVNSAPQNRVQKASASSKPKAPRRSTSKKLSVSTTAQPMTPPARTQVPLPYFGSVAVGSLYHDLYQSGHSYVQPRPYTPFDDQTPWRICFIQDRTTWELNERMSTKKYAAWKDTKVTLSRKAFQRMLNHPQAVHMMNTLKQNNELGRSVTLEFTAAYAETTGGKRYNVTNVWVKDLNDPTVELVWKLIPRTELEALNVPVAQA